MKIGYKRDDKPIEANFDKINVKKHAKKKQVESNKDDASTQLL